MNEQDFDIFFDIFIDECQTLVDEHNRKHHWETLLEVKPGRKYIKIIAKDIGDKMNGSRVWAFIDKSNGDILKPAGWKAPARHARGNIYDENPMLFIGPHGPAYMDTIKEYYGA